MREATAPIPYASAEVDDVAPTRLMQPLPMTLRELERFAQEDEDFLPPHWVRMRLAVDPEVGAAWLQSLRALAPLVTPGDKASEEALEVLIPDSRREGIAGFAAQAVDNEPPGPVADHLFALAASGRGERGDRVFERMDVPVSAHLLRLSTLRDHGGMPWSEAFETRVFSAMGSLPREAQAWTVRLVAELKDPAARAFLVRLEAAVSAAPLGAEIRRFLAEPPTFELPAFEEDPLPDDIEALELLALDPRKPERRVLALGAMADRDWPRARRLASSIASDEWRLDEVVGALLIHPSRSVMLEDFERRGLIGDGSIALPKYRPSARELMRRHGRVVRFDTASQEGLDGIVDHDALAYRLARIAPVTFEGVDFLEELDNGESIALEAWVDGRHYRVELDTGRSVIDPYGLLGLLNVIARDRKRPERFMLAAADKSVADVVVAPEKELRSLVDAGLLWIRAGFKW